MNDKIKFYFDKKANNYNLSSCRGLWNILRKLEKKNLLSFIKNKKFKKILELGSGSGFYTHFLTSYTKNKITCVDFSQSMLDQINIQNVNKINFNIEEYIDKSKYDLIFCAGAIEFVKDPLKVFCNSNKMLRKSGLFLILVPYKNIFGVLYKLFHLFHGARVNLFTDKTIFYNATRSGFKVIKTKKTGLFSACYAFELTKPKE